MSKTIKRAAVFAVALARAAACVLATPAQSAVSLPGTVAL